MKIKTKHRKGKTLKANKKAEIGFDECDIIVAQNGDSGAWYRIWMIAFAVTFRVFKEFKYHHKK